MFCEVKKTSEIVQHQKTLICVFAKILTASERIMYTKFFSTPISDIPVIFPNF